MVKPEQGKRISKIDTYLNCAEVFAYRSTCMKRKYGEVIVKDDVVILRDIMVHREDLKTAAIWGNAQG